MPVLQEDAPGAAPSSSPMSVQSWMPTTQQLDEWDEKLGNYKFIQAISKQTGLKKLHVAVLLLVVGTFLFSSGFGIDALATFIGFAYPARCTLKALKGDAEPDVVQFKFLLQYWLVFASFVAFEMLGYALVTMIPYWVILKIAFFFFCFMPHSRGAELVVEKVLEPAYAWVQEHVETHVKVFVSDAKKVIKDTTGIQLATPPASKKRTEKAE